MQEGSARAQDQGCREIASETEVANGASTRAHAAMGFEPAGEIRCFRRDLQSTGAAPEEKAAAVG